jgi:hypothetical protein
MWRNWRKGLASSHREHRQKSESRRSPKPREKAAAVRGSSMSGKEDKRIFSVLTHATVAQSKKNNAT